MTGISATARSFPYLRAARRWRQGRLRRGRLCSLCAPLQGSHVENRLPSIVFRHLRGIRRHVLLSVCEDVKHPAVFQCQCLLTSERRWRREAAHGDGPVTSSGPPVAGHAPGAEHECTTRECRKILEGIGIAQLFARTDRTGLRGLVIHGMKNARNSIGRGCLQGLSVGEVGIRRIRLVGGGSNHLGKDLHIRAGRLWPDQESAGDAQRQRNGQQQVEFHGKDSSARSITSTAPCRSSRRRTCTRSTAAAVSSRPSAKRSLVTPGMTVAARRPGWRRLTTNNAITVLMPANNTITSNVTGTKAGNEFHGLPPTLTGQSAAVAQYSNQSLATAPTKPSAKQTQGRRDGWRPIALSRPWTA